MPGWSPAAVTSPSRSSSTAVSPARGRPGRSCSRSSSVRDEPTTQTREGAVSDYRTFEPVNPQERPVRRRRTARVLLVDESDRILLFRDSDPGLPGRHWWITPGGGVEGAESDLHGAVRELHEETGLVADPGALVGPLARRTVRHGYTDVVVVQDEVFFGLQ